MGENLPQISRWKIKKTFELPPPSTVDSSEFQQTPPVEFGEFAGSKKMKYWRWNGMYSIYLHLQGEVLKTIHPPRNH